MKLQSQKLAKVYMSKWAKLGRFLEIYGPKFGDLDQRSHGPRLKDWPLVSPENPSFCRCLWLVVPER
jgi:hypothetical protein